MVEVETLSNELKESEMCMYLGPVPTIVDGLKEMIQFCEAIAHHHNITNRHVKKITLTALD